MKSIILVAVVLLAVAAGVPIEKEPPKIISSEFLQYPDNSYSFSFVSEDGTSRKETGVVREGLDENNELQKFIVVSGSYTFLNVEGQPETINYFADETGYHADGSSIPKPVSRR